MVHIPPFSGENPHPSPILLHPRLWAPGPLARGQELPFRAADLPNRALTERLDPPARGRPPTQIPASRPSWRYPA